MNKKLRCGSKSSKDKKQNKILKLFEPKVNKYK